MLYSIATVRLSGTLREKIAAIAEAGFQAVEIFGNDLIQHDGPVSEVRAMIEDRGLKVVTYQPFRDFEGLPEPLRTRAFERARRKLALTAALGCDLLMLCSSVSPRAEGGIGRAAEDLGARFGLSGARLAELATRGTLSDEDETGPYFQLFTRQFRGRFCFEIVQRDGYVGFGAANAAARTATQVREPEPV